VETTLSDVNDGIRESYVGLKDNWGTLMIGSLKSPFKYTGGVTYDPFVTTFLQARSNGGMSNGVFGSHSFMQNSVSYAVEAAGVKAWVAYSPDESGTAKGSKGDYTASLKYKIKAFEVFGAAAHDDQTVAAATSVNYADLSATGTPLSTTASTLGQYDSTKVGGAVNLGPVRITLQSEALVSKTLSKVTTQTGGLAPTVKTTDILTGKTETAVSFVGVQVKLDKCKLIAQAGQTAVKDAADKTGYMAAGLFHQFSKNTSALAGIMSSKTGDVTKGASSVGLRIVF